MARYTTTSGATVNGKSVKSLGWLLKNWRSIDRFRVTPGVGKSEATLETHTKSGQTFQSPFASRNVLAGVLDRPVFRGILVEWFGVPREAGELRKEEEQRILFEGQQTIEKRRAAFESDPGHELPRRFTVKWHPGSERWVLLWRGSAIENFPSKEDAIARASKMIGHANIAMRDTTDEIERTAAEFSEQSRAGNWRNAYDAWNRWAKLVSWLEVNEPGTFGNQLLNSQNILAREARRQGWISLEAWKKAGFGGSGGDVT